MYLIYGALSFAEFRKDSCYEIKVIGYLHTDNFAQILQFVVN